MIESGNSEINVDELMEKIREEVRQRKKRGVVPPRTVPRANDAPVSRPYASVDFSNISRLGEPEPFQQKDEGYDINDFLKYHDHQFVINAYRGILRRGPDSEAHEYFLKNLRSGKMTKAEVLGRLRYAPEGRAAKVKVSGLFWNFVVQSSFSIPVLGYFSRLVVGIVNLPLIIRNMQILDESTFTLFQQQRNQLDRKAERDELGSLRNELESVLDRKAERDELGFLKGEFAAIMDRKADKEQLALVNDQIRDILRQTRDHKLNIIDQQRRLKLLLEEARKRLPEPLSTEQIAEMVKEEDHLLDAAYVSFEDQFRGTREDIKERLKVYLPYIREAGAGTKDSPVIDVGCGRGEWLELLREERLTAQGVDINHLLVELCQDSGMEVTEGDAVEFLRQIPNTSVGAITGIHLIEHLPLRVMIALFDEALRVLKPGGCAIFETPNPENLIVGACNFYADPSHRNPLHPEMIKFLIENRGFCHVLLCRTEPFSEEFRLKEDGTEIVRRFNKFFYGPQNYSVVGVKP